MRIIPAIDIIDAKCVRLTKGDYNTKKIYNENPLEVAKEFEASGIEYLHVVDLDGAKASQIINYKVLEQIASKTNLKIDFPQVHFELDRNRIADLGMTVNDVSQQLSVYLSGNYVNRFNLDGKAYRVIPMLEDSKRLDVSSIQQIQLQTPRGALVPFSSLASVEERVGPRALSKFQQRNSFTVMGGLIPIFTKEQGLAALEEAAKDILPPGYVVDYAGESRQIRQEGNTLFGALAFALAFVFLVLVVLFNSLRDPLVVLLGCVPLAISGALMFTFLGWTSINIYSQIGFITLVGLIAKNGILVVEFANHLQLQGRSKIEAILEGASVRLRPVLMTTGATVVGHFPLVLVSGAGAEARNSIGIILVAGMLIGTLFTLFILPSVYLLLASNHKKGEASLDAYDGGVTQAMFPEGGLSLDGKLAPAKLGLLKYIADGYEEGGRDVLFVPVALNYDRVLEDRILMAADAAGTRRFHARISVVAGFMFKQLWLRLIGRFHRFGYAAVSFGPPVSLRAHANEHGLPDAEHLAIELMEKIAAVVPVVPVPLLATVMLENSGAPKESLPALMQAQLDQMGSAYVHMPRDDISYAADIALKHLSERRILRVQDGRVFADDAQLAALRYYANSIVHLTPRAAGAA